MNVKLVTVLYYDDPQPLTLIFREDTPDEVCLEFAKKNVSEIFFDGGEFSDNDVVIIIATQPLLSIDSLTQ